MDTNPNIGRVLEGKYEIIKILGEGGMGEVYEARHKLINRRLAIKLLRKDYAKNAEMVERFTREARASAAIGHDHIVEITDMGVVESGELFIVMEYLEGQDLERLLLGTRPLPAQRACHIMIQVLSALEVAHAKGIVHRDLKPANIFLTTHAGVKDYAKIVDFGISKVWDSDTSPSKGLTKTGILLGTPSYMSPEQAAAVSDITPATDIFAAGVILYEMLTGRLPFEGSSMPIVLTKILKEEPTDPGDINPEIPAEISDTIKRAMAKTPEDRFGDAAAFRREITPFSPETDDMTGLATTRLSGRAAEFHENMGRLKNEDAAASLRRVVSGVAPAPAGAAMNTTVSNGPSSKWPRFLFIFAAAAVLVIVGLILLRGFFDSPIKGSMNEQSPPPKNSMAHPDPKEGVGTVAIRIETTPKSAWIVIDGEVKGKGTFTGSFPKGDKTTEITIRAEGYIEEKQIISLARSVSMVVKLEEAEPENLVEKKESEQSGAAGNAASKKHRPKAPRLGSSKNPPAVEGAKETTKSGAGQRVIDEESPW